MFAVCVRDVAQPGSVLAWGARGRKFESCRPDRTIKPLHFAGAFLMRAIEARFKKRCIKKSKASETNVA